MMVPGFEADAAGRWHSVTLSAPYNSRAFAQAFNPMREPVIREG